MNIRYNYIEKSVANTVSVKVVRYMDSGTAESDRTLLYHGTITPFETIDTQMGFPYKDFGRGFYAGEDRNQAIGLANNRKAGKLKAFTDGLLQNPLGLSVEEYEARIVTYVYTYEFNWEMARCLQDQQLLEMKVFDGPSLEWFDFVIWNRDTEPTIHGFDIVVGPTVNDDVTLVVSRYLAGRYGSVTSETAKRKALKDLKVEKLGIQFYFRSSVAVSLISRVREEVIT